MYLCQYCGEVFDEPTVDEEKDVGYHGLICPQCGEALGPLSELEARPCPLCSGWRWKNDAACGTCRLRLTKPAIGNTFPSHGRTDHDL